MTYDEQERMFGSERKVKVKEQQISYLLSFFNMWKMHHLLERLPRVWVVLLWILAEYFSLYSPLRVLMLTLLLPRIFSQIAWSSVREDWCVRTSLVLWQRCETTTWLAFDPTLKVIIILIIISRSKTRVCLSWLSSFWCNLIRLFTNRSDTHCKSWIHLWSVCL